MNIYLIGYRACGKSSAGEALARRIDYGFMDMDAVISEECSLSISEMVERYGWKFFRDREKALLERLKSSTGYVIATGGGVVLDPDNVAVMQKSGRVIWLTASAETIEKRMLLDPSTQSFRPSLTAKSLSAEIMETLAERTPLYEKAAHGTIDSEGKSVSEICTDIVRSLGDFINHRPPVAHFVPQFRSHRH